MNKRYAVIGRLTKQVGVFVDNPKSVNTKYNILVDLENHPQAKEIELDWFYDESTNTFFEEGEIHYPELQPPQPTQLDRIESMLSSSNEQLRQEGADALTLELIERGIL